MGLSGTPKKQRFAAPSNLTLTGEVQMSISDSRNRKLETARRDFLKCSAGLAAASVCVPGLNAAEAEKQTAESLVKVFYDTLDDKQKSVVCYDWDYVDPKRGLLRTRVANNWNINSGSIHGDFYTKDQQQMLRKIFEGIISPEWIERYDKQLEDDCGGFGREQSVGIFGVPGQGKFELVLTGRHMTLRCDGNSIDSVAFGGPIFYGHAPTGGDEEKDHEGNVFWQQAVSVNKVYQMLDGKQRGMAEVSKTPAEQKVAFQGKDGRFTGLPVTELSSDQKEQLQKSLGSLLEPFRVSDRHEALECLKAQGGLDACHLSFYTDEDLGKDKVWDNWRLEGPSFVWHFRGAPHVHVWVNIADSANVKLNA
jgi:Protein of unknown function (DUF3500)